MRATKFNSGDVGCYADSSLGHQHVRSNLADLVEEFSQELATALRGEMSDDAWEEDAALDVLNGQAKGVRFDFYNGDLMCMTDAEWSEAND